MAVGEEGGEEGGASLGQKQGDCRSTACLLLEGQIEIIIIVILKVSRSLPVFTSNVKSMSMYPDILKTHKNPHLQLINMGGQNQPSVAIFKAWRDYHKATSVS